MIFLQMNLLWYKRLIAAVRHLTTSVQKSAQITVWAYYRFRT